MNFRNSLKKCGLYFITDSTLSYHSVLRQAELAIEAGCTVIQYREKVADRKTIKITARKLRELCFEKNVLFLINDYIDIAAEVDADGVHIGQEDIPYYQARQLLGQDKIIGVSCHTIEQAQKAEEIGADYIGFGPVFATTTKPILGNPVGVEKLQEVVVVLEIPVVAIGGINHRNLDSVLRVKPAGFVMISALLKKEDLVQEIKSVVGKR